MAYYGTPKFNTRDTIATGSSLNPPANGFTLTSGSFGSPSGTQLLVVDWDVSAKAVVISCTIVGTAVSNVTYLDGAVAATHAQGANVTMAFTPTQYTSLADGSGMIPGVFNQGLVSNGADQALTGTLTDVAGLSKTFVVPAGGRSVRMTIASKLQQNSDTNSSVTYNFLEDGSAFDSKTVHVSQAGVGLSHTLTSQKTVSSGTHTYKIQANYSGGASAPSVKASTLLYVDLV